MSFFFFFFFFWWHQLAFRVRQSWLKGEFQIEVLILIPEQTENRLGMQKSCSLPSPIPLHILPQFLLFYLPACFDLKEQALFPWKIAQIKICDCRAWRISPLNDGLNIFFQILSAKYLGSSKEFKFWLMSEIKQLAKEGNTQKLR